MAQTDFTLKEVCLKRFFFFFFLNVDEYLLKQAFQTLSVFKATTTSVRYHKVKSIELDP